MNPSARIRTVLLIEDNEQNRYLATFLLEQRGYRIASACDGPTGISMARAEAPDLILLDIQLPLMNGYEVARELRRRAGKRPLHIAAVTGSANPDVRARTHAAGFDQHLAKPTDAAKLRHVLYIADLKARSA